MQVFDILLIQPIVNILVAFYQLLSWANIPHALGFAIILLTIFVRLLMYPLTTKQLQVSKKMQEMAPQLAKIKEKHKGDMRAQQEATMALYREHNINPAAGCLPGLVQILVLLFGLYPALMKVLTTNAKDTVSMINHLLYTPTWNLAAAWDTRFFGVPLEKTPEQLLSTLGPVVFLIPLLTAVFQFIQSKMMLPPTPKGALAVKDSSKQEDFATTFQKQSLYLLPIMIGFFAYFFSVGLSLYWNTFTIFGIIQQYLVSGLGGVEDWIKKPNKKK
jgi:YidC/Oxa1 family membrane protein insertase